MAKYTHWNVLDGHGWNVEECLENGNQSTQRLWAQIKVLVHMWREKLCEKVQDAILKWNLINVQILSFWNRL